MPLYDFTAASFLACTNVCDTSIGQEGAPNPLTPEHYDIVLLFPVKMPTRVTLQWDTWLKHLYKPARASVAHAWAPLEIFPRVGETDSGENN